MHSWRSASHCSRGPCDASTLVTVLQTAEMPGLYQPGEYDVAGFAVGSVKQDRVIDGKQIQEGNVLIALPSSGLHSNGYSLVRKVVEASTVKNSCGRGCDNAAKQVLASQALLVNCTDQPDCWFSKI